MERVHLDILGPINLSERGNKYILSIIDQFSKWIECYPLPNQTTETIARTLVDNVFTRFGVPLEIHTDQGKNFDGSLFHELCSILPINKTRTTAYQPCSNGQVERYNRTLMQMVRCFIYDRPRTWDRELQQQLTGAIRSTVHRQTGYSSNMMMYGQVL
jgi:transposase InsO family protein